MHKILRATVKRHLPREIETAKEYAAKDPGASMGRIELASAVWRYLSVAETAFETMVFMMKTPHESVKELGDVCTIAFCVDRGGKCVPQIGARRRGGAIQ